MKFKLFKQIKLKRYGQLKIGKTVIETPVFMPCATNGAVKGISSEELQNLGFKIILGNTYHLYLRPGEKIIKKQNNLQNFIHWPGAILTDSGGYQVFSLGHNFKTKENKKNEPLVTLSKRGIWFRSHLDGSKHLFSPEKVIAIQLDLGSNIIMPLDFCPSADATHAEIEKAVDLTNIWFKRAWEHFQEKTKNLKPAEKPALFAIVQGGYYKDLRQKSFEFLNQFPVNGFAIGGVANAGESKLKQRKAIEYTEPLLPKNKPRYLMGVGEPEDIIWAVNHGIDMFDCVLPTRLGRHGTIWITQNWRKFTKIDLRKTKFQVDEKILMKNCECPACNSKYTKSYLSHLIKSREMLGMRFLSLHNLWILAELMRKIRNS
jgi:queuine tRNA-ribosyltransferase